ncbi:hypothetical protein PG993_010233 [Apiospora rasikravindrae]|uniref:Uncharacterized protein n=1 Tax=Apiospora rasikravindrae TaxID=990691 RepID=A0ABR1SNZ3_9PEZI
MYPTSTYPGYVTSPASLPKSQRTVTQLSGKGDDETNTFPLMAWRPDALQIRCNSHHVYWAMLHAAGMFWKLSTLPSTWMQQIASNRRLHDIYAKISMELNAPVAVITTVNGQWETQTDPNLPMWPEGTNTSTGTSTNTNYVVYATHSHPTFECTHIKSAITASGASTTYRQVKVSTARHSLRQQSIICWPALYGQDSPSVFVLNDRAATATMQVSINKHIPKNAMPSSQWPHGQSWTLFGP